MISEFQGRLGWHLCDCESERPRFPYGDGEEHWELCTCGNDWTEMLRDLDEYLTVCENCGTVCSRADAEVVRMQPHA